MCSRQGDGSHRQPVDSNRVVVRARVRSHLDAIKERFPDLLANCEIKDFVSTGYAYRFFVEKSVWSQVLVGLNEEMDYDIFKSEVGRFQGRDKADYEHSLHEVWSVL